MNIMQFDAAKAVFYPYTKEQYEREMRENMVGQYGFYYALDLSEYCSADGELMMTILASYAQEESRAVSENMKWRVRHNYENGLAWTSLDGLWGMYDLSGNEIFKLRFSALPETQYGPLTLVVEAGRFGLISVSERRMVLPTEYEMISGQENGNILVRKEGKYGLYDARN